MSHVGCTYRKSCSLRHQQMGNLNTQRHLDSGSPRCSCLTPASTILLNKYMTKMLTMVKHSLGKPSTQKTRHILSCCSFDIVSVRLTKGLTLAGLKFGR
jgi:hypothetical protein